MTPIPSHKYMLQCRAGVDLAQARQCPHCAGYGAFEIPVNEGGAIGYRIEDCYTCKGWSVLWTDPESGRAA